LQDFILSVITELLFVNKSELDGVFFLLAHEANSRIEIETRKSFCINYVIWAKVLFIIGISKPFM
jgi:hypothetical protein